MKRPPRQSAFSLIELMIAISIIGLLIAASVISYNTARRTARDSKRISDLLVMSNAFNTALPHNDIRLLIPATSQAVCTTGGIIDQNYGGIKNYLPSKTNNSIPTDPLSSSNGEYNYRLYVNDKSPTSTSMRTRSNSPVVALKLRYMFTALLEGTPPPDSDVRLARDMHSQQDNISLGQWETLFSENIVVTPGTYCGEDCPVKYASTTGTGATMQSDPICDGTPQYLRYGI